MKQFAVIGLSTFGRRALEELVYMDLEILLIDRDQEVIQNYKNQVSNVFVLDVIKLESLKKIIPRTLDVAIIDLGDNIEATFLITNYLRELGIKQIVVKADSDQHGNILKILGATMVVFPDKEAVKRIIPLLTSNLLLNYFPISEELIIAEVKVPGKFMAKTLIEADLRKNYQLNVIAVKSHENDNYHNFSPDYRFGGEDIILVSGNEKSISGFINYPLVQKNKGVINFIRKLLFSRKPR
ncbi:MAG: TrkA family potassium uptake protein [Spirochaetales bacterium]|nr:TrkA family potassium uptake protein [Spirochaetales bacterium]